MNNISLRICGDHWLNPMEVQHLLQSTVMDQPLYVDVGAEGASLTALGVTDMLREHCKIFHRDPSTVHVINWPNSQDTLEFSVQPFLRSHFFGMSRRYWLESAPISALSAKLFGLFLGRMTIARAVILRHCMQQWPENFLFSKMLDLATKLQSAQEYGINLDCWQEWIGTQDGTEVMHWWNSVDIGSIDATKVRDQYNSAYNTNLSLLHHYHKFRIELVAETFTRGDTFFPTEKTVRGLVGGKPLIIYGPRHFLKNLRAMGFHTWQDIWDESYDDHEGPERWKKIKLVISTLTDMFNTNAQDLTQHTQSICAHNRDVIAKMNGARC